MYMNPAEVNPKSRILLLVKPLRKTDISRLRNNDYLFKELHPAVPVGQFQVHQGSKESHNIKYNIV